MKQDKSFRLINYRGYNKSGQAIAEYAIVILLVAAVLAVMGAYIRRGLQARVADFSYAVAPEEMHYVPKTSTAQSNMTTVAPAIVTYENGTLKTVVDGQLTSRTSTEKYISEQINGTNPPSGERGQRENVLY